MKDCLICSRCKKKMKITKEIRSNLQNGLTYICSCGGRYK